MTSDHAEDPHLVLQRSTHPGWLSNAYLVGDLERRVAVVIDTGAPLEPLLGALDRDALRLEAVLCTHRHPDHIAGNGEFVRRTGAPLFALREEALHITGSEALEDGEERSWGNITVRAIHLPGHTTGHAGFLVNGVGLFCGDALFAGSLGSTSGAGPAGFEMARRSIVDRILSFPDDTPLHPGHAGRSTVGRERQSNPFIRVMTGLDAEGKRRCTAFGKPARLIVMARDYDGGTKAWVRFEEDGRDRVVAGSRIEIHVPIPKSRIRPGDPAARRGRGADAFRPE